MMAEVVIVSSIVLVFLTGLYVSYNKLYSIYSARINYYDIVTLYRLGYYRDSILSKDAGDDWNELLEGVNLVSSIKSGDDSIIGDKYSGDTVYVLKNNDKNLNDDSNNEIIEYFKDNSTINVTLKEYVDYLSTSVDFSDNEYEMDYVMILESCISTDECKYAYLEVDKVE